MRLHRIASPLPDRTGEVRGDRACRRIDRAAGHCRVAIHGRPRSGFRLTYGWRCSSPSSSAPRRCAAVHHRKGLVVRPLLSLYVLTAQGMQPPSTAPLRRIIVVDKLAVLSSMAVQGPLFDVGRQRRRHHQCRLPPGGSRTSRPTARMPVGDDDPDFDRPCNLLRMARLTVPVCPQYHDPGNQKMRWRSGNGQTHLGSALSCPHHAGVGVNSLRRWASFGYPPFSSAASPWTAMVWGSAVVLGDLDACRSPGTSTPRRA